MKTIPKKIKIILFVVIFTALSATAYGAFPYIRFAYYKRLVASTGLPTQIGLGKVITITDCEWKVVKCVGAPMCFMVPDPPTCALSSDVLGVMSGGTGAEFVALKTALALTGVTEGSQVIAGGLLPSQISVLAGILGKWGI
ncbi:MAG: hypothetical protein WCK11_04020 [Candidatus Falkowbacteria bacterium]